MDDDLDQFLYGEDQTTQPPTTAPTAPTENQPTTAGLCESRDCLKWSRDYIDDVMLIGVEKEPPETEDKESVRPDVNNEDSDDSEDDDDDDVIFILSLLLLLLLLL